MDNNLLNNIEMCRKKNEWVEYYELAEPCINNQWNGMIFPILREENIDFKITLDLACGAGRNSMKLIPLTEKLYCVDLNKYALDLCKKNLKEKNDENNFNKIIFIQNNGFEISSIPNNSLTFIYQFDSGVHMSKEVIRMYIKEFSRILKVNGKGFFHHSNYGNLNNDKDKSNFKNNPHWRTDMTKELFKKYCEEFGLVCIRQEIINWGLQDLDCLSIFQKISD